MLESIGLTIPEACRLFLTRIVRDKYFICDLFTPNAKTLEAITPADKY
ncbi:MAG: type II toxin-antitoxin system RelB/DinJ family antitoxin [Deltaproteobacteria bacterium]|nr:type II toxin-antitoxin system RelB/DinJ family antitoxin [Deltaproteobacteria bacterium]